MSAAMSALARASQALAAMVAAASPSRTPMMGRCTEGSSLTVAASSPGFPDLASVATLTGELRNLADDVVGPERFNPDPHCFLAVHHQVRRYRPVKATQPSTSMRTREVSRHGPLGTWLSSLTALAVAAFILAATPQAVASPHQCPTLVFDQNRPEDSFYAIRVQHITCTNANRVLTRYRHAQARCITRWRCTYNVRVSWADRPRVRLARGDRRIWFAITQ